MAIVSVSRKIGSLGDEIAALVAQKLGYKLISREEIHQMAQECDEEFRHACSMFEAEEAKGFYERLIFRDPAFTALFESLNFELAAQGDMVILGRGAQIVFQGFPDVFRVRVVAPSRVRVHRMSQRMNVGNEEAAEFIRRHDHQRRHLIQEIFQRDLSDWSLYNMMLNTELITAEEGAEVVESAVRVVCGPGKPVTPKETFENLAFAKRVESAIKKKVVTAPYRDIRVTAEPGGRVTVEGVVQDKRVKDKVTAVAQAMEGVTSVVNELRTTEIFF